MSNVSSPRTGDDAVKNDVMMLLKNDDENSVPLIT